MKKITFLLCISFLLACQNNDDDSNSNLDVLTCNQVIIVNNNEFQNAETAPFTFTEVSLASNCLLLEYAASGCDGSSWTVALIDSGEIMETNPPQRNLKLVLSNPELCAAVITDETSFDISELQIEGINQIRINFENWEQSFLYEY